MTQMGTSSGTLRAQEEKRTSVVEGEDEDSENSVEPDDQN